MDFRFYGAAGEVGRSCIEVDNRFLLDAGLKITEEGTEYPVVHDLSHIDAVFLSHAHLDHCGALAYFNKLGLRCSIFSNTLTKETAKILMKDSLKIEMINKQHPIYTKENLKLTLGAMQTVKNSKRYKNYGIRYSFHYAGHIPGAASILLEIDGMRILYTGDFNTIDTHLVDGAKMDFRDIDVMIVESTYGDRDHDDRAKEEKRFLDTISAVLDKGGSVLIPVFAVGRAQEVLQILNQRKFGVPIYLDGMSKKITSLYLKRPEYVTGHDELKRAVKAVNYVKSWKDRRKITSEQSIIVTTSGMLDGGPVIDYLGYYYHNRDNAVLLTGYQGDGSNGRLLLDEGSVYLDGIRVKVKALVDKFDFSAHPGRKEIIAAVKKISPRHLILQHGDSEPLMSLKSALEKTVEVHIPMIGDEIRIEKG